MTKFVRKLNVFCGIIVMVFLLVVTMGCVKDNKKFVDQGEVGTFYSYYGDTQAELTLNENNANFKMGGQTIIGTYTFDGTSLQITFEGGQGINVKYTTNTITFGYNNVTYTLYRNVTYTVTFNVNGGSEVPQQTVVNGKKVTKPVDPTKKDAMFVGWYQDSTYKTEYDFDNVVTDNLSLYAKFADDLAYDTEYTVTYVTNVEGVEVPTQQTFNNTLYKLPTLEVSGKMFLGWWVSDYEDGSKLTYKYEPLMRIESDTTLYAVYANETSIDVSVLNGHVIFDTLYTGSARTYSLKVFNANNLTGDPLFTYNRNDNDVNFDFNEYEPGEYVVEVQRGNATGKAYVRNKALTRVSKLEIVNGNTLKWNKVEGATSYLVTAQCGVATYNIDRLNVGNTNSYNFDDVVMGRDGITFTVTAVADGYLSTDSKTYNYYRSLEEAKNVKYDNVKQEVTWDSVEGATSYKVVVQRQNGNPSEYNVTENKLSLGNFYGVLNVYVTPVAKLYYAATSELNVTKNELKVPTNISLVGYNVLWDEVEDAVSYVVVVNGETFTSTTNSLTLSLAFVEQNTEFVVSIKAVASDSSKNSVASDAVTINKVGVNQVAYQNGYVTWNAVPGVVAYAVKVDNGTVELVRNDNKVAKAIGGGTHTVSVAMCDSTDNYGNFYTATINVYTLTFNSLGGSVVESMYFATGDTLTLPSPSYEGYEFKG